LELLIGYRYQTGGKDSMAAMSVSYIRPTKSTTTQISVSSITLNFKFKQSHRWYFGNTDDKLLKAAFNVTMFATLSSFLKAVSLFKMHYGGQHRNTDRYRNDEMVTP
jgi:hypothetical protein